jgi:hypothetical protein
MGAEGKTKEQDRRQRLASAPLDTYPQRRRHRVRKAASKRESWGRMDGTGTIAGLCSGHKNRNRKQKGFL